jgi:hypothetical protein
MPKPLATVLTIVVAIALSAAAAAGTTEPSQVSAIGLGPHGEPGGVGIISGPGAHQIAVRNPTPVTIIVSDSGGVTAQAGCGSPAGFSPPGCGCESIDTMTVRCDTPYGTHVGARGSAGDDTIRVLDPIVLWARGRSGADHLAGNARNDYLNGDEGDDELSGHAGNDRVYSGSGHDVAYGGDGNDLLLTKDQDRDRVIDCGRGNDRAFIDRGLDPQPRHCEHVHLGPVGA